MIYRILATLTFFTRLPLWRICNIPAEHYKHVVPLWPLVGWVTGTVMGVVFLAAQCFLPPLAAALLALGSRLLLTGALHEDGFADFCDGFGGGTTRERILAIMKDSHIGTYGVLGLVFYILTMASLLTRFPQSPLLTSHPSFFVLVIVAIDTACKFFASHIIYNLSYARTAEQAKNKLVYACVSSSERLVSILLMLLPLSLLFILAPCALSIPMLLKCTALMLLAASIVSRLTFRFIGKRIQGYTGDCCGATFVICELSSYIVLTAML